MRYRFLAFSAFFLMSQTVLAYEAECLIPHEKMKPCDVFFQENALSIQFSKGSEKLGTTIPGEKIIRIKEGESARKETMKTFIMGPLMFFSLFGKTQAVGEVFGIEYLDRNEKPSTLFLRLKKREGVVFGTSLRKLKSQ